MDIDTLILRDDAKNQLLQIRTIESGLEYLSKVKAIETWAKAEKLDAEMQTLIAEQKLRTQRIIGKLIQEGQEKGEIASQKSDMGNQYKVLPSTEEYSKPRTLSDIGLTAKQSHVYQKIAEIPEEGSPKGLFGNDLKVLSVCENHRHLGWGKYGMVYWAIENLINLTEDK